jgi:hypothetical protein
MPSTPRSLRCLAAHRLLAPQLVVDPAAIKKKIEEERVKEAQRPGAKRYV